MTIAKVNIDAVYGGATDHSLHPNGANAVCVTAGRTFLGVGSNVLIFGADWKPIGRSLQIRNVDPQHIVAVGPPARGIVAIAGQAQDDRTFIHSYTPDAKAAVQLVAVDGEVTWMRGLGDRGLLVATSRGVVVAEADEDSTWMVRALAPVDVWTQAMVTKGGLLCLADANGRVRAFATDAASNGKPAWSYDVGGPIEAPPIEVGDFLCVPVGGARPAIVLLDSAKGGERDRVPLKGRPTVLATDGEQLAVAHGIPIADRVSPLVESFAPASPTEHAVTLLGGLEPVTSLAISGSVLYATTDVAVHAFDRENRRSAVLAGDGQGVVITADEQGAVVLGGGQLRRLTTSKLVPSQRVLTSEKRRALARKYAPVVYLHKDEEFLPSSVEWYLERAEVVWCQLPQDPFDATDKKKQKVLCSPPIPNDALLAVTNTQSDELTRISLPDTAAGKAARAGQGTSAPIYFCVRKVRKGLLAIDYWFFYPFNGSTVAKARLRGYAAGIILAASAAGAVGGFIPIFLPITILAGAAVVTLIANLAEFDRAGGNMEMHTGDWEGVRVFVRESDESLVAVNYVYHGDPRLVPRAQVPLEGERPIVYSARSSHASYPSVKDWPNKGIFAIDSAQQGTRWDVLDSATSPEGLGRLVELVADDANDAFRLREDNADTPWVAWRNRFGGFPSRALFRETTLTQIDRAVKDGLREYTDGPTGPAGKDELSIELAPEWLDPKWAPPDGDAPPSAAVSVERSELVAVAVTTRTKVRCMVVRKTAQGNEIVSVEERTLPTAAGPTLAVAWRRGEEVLVTQPVDPLTLDDDLAAGKAHVLELPTSIDGTDATVEEVGGDETALDRLVLRHRITYAMPGVAPVELALLITSTP